MGVTLTENAAKHVASYLSKRGKGIGLRLGVRTSGCSGVAYKLEFADVAEPEDLQFSPKHLASLIELAEAGSVNNQVAKEVFEQIFAEDVDPEAYVEEHGLKTVNDTGLLEETTRKVLENNPGPVEQYKSGKTKVLGFLVGQVMKEMKGKANPAAAGELLQKLLSE